MSEPEPPLCSRLPALSHRNPIHPGIGLPLLPRLSNCQPLNRSTCRLLVACPGLQAADAVGGNGCGTEYATLVFGGVLGLKDALRLLQAGPASCLCRFPLSLGRAE